MAPVRAVVRAKSLAEFGTLVRHAGEEFSNVVRGQIAVHTEFYDPVVLSVGQSMYIDSTMGHGYPSAAAVTRRKSRVMSSPDEELMDVMLHIHEERRRAVSENAPARTLRCGARS